MDQKEKSEYTFRALMQRHPIPCETEKMAWLTLNNIQRGISVLLCDKPPDNRLARCETFFYRPLNDENE
jgi:hypothetical protein